ncbi:MAG: zinc ribbon domain-containing protein [Planctomycetes bacterium]|nr:zinc ribbon domain-containing protein [Planctomycetota bacterium]
MKNECHRCGEVFDVDESRVGNATDCPKCGITHEIVPGEIADEPVMTGCSKKGWGWEYKSRARIFGIPLLHISFKYRANKMPVPARGVIAIGQFGAGVVNISQIGIGVFSLSQITVAGFAVAQIGVAYSLIAQVGLYVDQGFGQIVKSIYDLI